MGCSGCENDMDAIVKTLAENPYAVAIGLLLSALPVLISTVKMLYRGLTFIWGVAHLGYQKQMRRLRWQQARRAHAVRSTDRLIELCTIRIMRMIALATSFLVSTLVFVVFMSEKYDGIIPDPIYPMQSHNGILIVGIIAALFVNIGLTLEGVQIGEIFRTRRRLLAKANARLKRL